MKNILWCPVLLFCYLLNGQADKAEEILKNAARVYVDQFAIEAVGKDKTVIRMPYSAKSLIHPPRPGEWEGRRLLHIDLIFTKYPKNNDKNQRDLNKMRILELAKLIPKSLALLPDNWTLVVQTACRSKKQASRLFHGLVLTFSDSYESPDFTDEAALPALIGNDSTVLNVIERNAGWKKMLVVTDLTSSMSPYTAQLMLWFKLNETKKQVEHFVFFNDGDGKEDQEKEIGRTGGIYDGKAKTFDEIAALASQAAEMGYGGDIPENNIEALLFGLEVCPECEDVVMIADNWATPRDLSLLGKVGKPVKIILCGTEIGINVAYLNIALHTSGSVHTIEDDIYKLLEINEGQELKIGKEVFIIKDGRFELLKRI